MICLNNPELYFPGVSVSDERSLLGRQTHLLQRLHLGWMADECNYNIIIGHHLSSLKVERNVLQFCSLFKLNL